MKSTSNVSNTSLLNQPVVSLNDGTRIGDVSDLLIDSQKLQLIALVLKTEGGQTVLPIANVQSFGEDAVTVGGMNATQSAANSQPGLSSFSDLQNLTVVDSSGTKLGKIHDAEFNTSSGKMESVEVHSGGVFGIGSKSFQLPAEDVCSLGPDLITVKDRTVVA